MSESELQDQLLKDARHFDPASKTRSILDPHRDAILLFRVKFMSYEVIAATLTRHGIKVSPAAVGCFCRRNFSKAQIQSERRRLSTTNRLKSEVERAPEEALRAPRVDSRHGPRGPKIARDDF